MLTFYGYKKCKTCLDVEKILKEKNLDYNFIDITTNPPSKKILNQILKDLNLNPEDLINKSSKTYKELQIKEKIKNLNKSEIIDLLIENPKLIKRPIIFHKEKNLVSIGKNIENII